MSASSFHKQFVNNLRAVLGKDPLYGQPEAPPVHEFVEFGHWQDMNLPWMPASQRRWFKRQGNRMLSQSG